MANLEIDYKKAAQQLRSGEALFGKDGALAPMLERILNAALEGEMDAHLNSVDCSSGNRRNGKMSKTVQTKYGEVIVEPLVTVTVLLNRRQLRNVRQFLLKVWQIKSSTCMLLVQALVI